MTYKEFRKWLYENWDTIYDEFEKSVAKKTDLCQKTLLI